MSAAADLPTGFKPVAMGGRFVAINGPLYVCEDGAAVKLGMRIEQRHCSPLGTCHGGMLATFVDMMMPLVIYDDGNQATAGRFLPTVSLQLDFMAPARMGDWVEGEGQVLRVTRSLVFARGLVRSDDRILLRCSGVYKIANETGDSPGMYTEHSPEENAPR